MPRYKNPRKTWAYSTEFKIQAVKLSSDPDYKISDVADGLGIQATVVKNQMFGTKNITHLSSYLSRVSALGRTKQWTSHNL